MKHEFTTLGTDVIIDGTNYGELVNVVVEDIEFVVNNWLLLTRMDKLTHLRKHVVNPFDGRMHLPLQIHVSPNNVFSAPIPLWAVAKEDTDKICKFMSGVFEDRHVIVTAPPHDLSTYMNGAEVSKSSPNGYHDAIRAGATLADIKR